MTRRPVAGVVVLAFLVTLAAGAIRLPEVVTSPEPTVTVRGHMAPTRGTEGVATLDSALLAVGADLADIAVDPARPRAYIADRSNARILTIELDNATFGPTIPVRAEPIGLDIDPTGSTLYVAHPGATALA